MMVSFVILNYKSLNHLRINLKYLSELSFPFETEVIVVDNASGDGSVEMMRERYPDVTLIQNKENVGHPSGNNIGIRQATGTYVCILNPDVIIRDVSDVVKVVGFMESSPKVGIVGPRLHNPDGSVQSSCYRPYSTYTPIYRRTIIGKLPFAQRDVDRHLMVDFAHDKTIAVEWLLGACLFMRKEMLDQIGLLDERLFLYFGDYELCDRARHFGWGVIYFHDTSRITHYHKRESAARRFSIMQALSYVTRIHLRDWRKYKKTPPYDKSV